MPHHGYMTTTVQSYQELLVLDTGSEFTIRLAKDLSWSERHGIFYRTANRQVTITLWGGDKITGILEETPGYFSRGTKAGARVWLRVPGRKTRKSVDIFQIRRLHGFKAPSLEEAVTALVYLNASSPTVEQVAEARATAALM